MLVALSAGRPNGWATGSVEQSELDADRVGDFAHDATQSVHFADQMSLRNAPNRGVTRHLGDEIDVQSEEGGLQPHARGRHGGLTSGVPGADYHYIELFREALHGCCFLF